MDLRRGTLGLVCGIAGLLISSGVADATSLFRVSWTEVGSYTARLTQTVGGSTSNVSFGLGVAEASVSVSGGPWEAIGRTWCIDIENVTSGSWDVECRVDGTSFSSNDGGFDGEDQNRIGDWRQVAWLVNTFGNSANTEAEIIALNFALYKAAYGSNFAASTGGNGGDYGFGTSFGLTKFTAYNAYLAALGTAPAIAEYSAYGYGSARWYDNDFQGQGYQDHMGVIPEPGTVILLGLGLFGIAGTTWRRRRRPADV